MSTAAAPGDSAGTSGGGTGGEGEVSAPANPSASCAAVASTLTAPSGADESAARAGVATGMRSAIKPLHREERQRQAQGRGTGAGGPAAEGSTNADRAGGRKALCLPQLLWAAQPAVVPFGAAAAAAPGGWSSPFWLADNTSPYEPERSNVGPAFYLSLPRPWNAVPREDERRGEVNQW